MSRDAEGVSLFAPGAAVRIGADGEIPARVTAIRINPGFQVEYQVTWWNGLDSCCNWFDAFEVQSNGSPTVSVGFK